MTVDEARVRLEQAQRAEAKAKAAVLEATRLHKQAQDTTRMAWLEHRNAILAARRGRQVVHWD